MSDGNGEESKDESAGSDSASSLPGDGKIGLRKWWKDLTWNEAHLMVLGFYAGFVAIRPKPRQKPVDRLNWKGMYVVGYLLKIGVIVVAGPEYAPQVAEALRELAPVIA